MVKAVPGTWGRSGRLPPGIKVYISKISTNSTGTANRSLKLIQRPSQSSRASQAGFSTSSARSGSKIERRPCSSNTASSSPWNTMVYTTASSRSYSVKRAPGVSRCNPFWMAAMPLEAENSVVIKANDATNVVDWAFRLSSTPKMVSWISGTWGKNWNSSSATLSMEYPGRWLTTTSTPISSGKDAVSKNSVAQPANTGMLRPKNGPNTASVNALARCQAGFMGAALLSRQW